MPSRATLPWSSLTFFPPSSVASGLNFTTSHLLYIFHNSCSILLCIFHIDACIRNWLRCNKYYRVRCSNTNCSISVLKCRTFLSYSGWLTSIIQTVLACLLRWQVGFDVYLWNVGSCWMLCLLWAVWMEMRMLAMQFWL